MDWPARQWALKDLEEDDVALHDSGSGPTPGFSVPPNRVRILLGIALILAGILVLGDIALAKTISRIFIGFTAIVVGGFEVIQAFWTKGWGDLVWQILLGVLYVAFGIVIFSQPTSGALFLTYVLGLLLLLSGIVRISLGASHWNEGGWKILLSGTFGVVAGLLIVTRFPMGGLWVLGLLLGIDLITHGMAWLTYAWLPAAFGGRVRPG